MAAGKTLTPDEEVAFSNYKVKQAIEEHPELEDILNEYNAAYAERTKDYDVIGSSGPAAQRAQGQKYNKLAELKKQIDDIAGPDADYIIQYNNRVQDRINTERNNADATKNNNLVKSIASGILHSSTFQNIYALTTQFDTDRAEGLSVNTDSPEWRNVNKSTALQQDYSEGLDSGFGQWLYGATYSTADSLSKRIVPMLMAAGGVPQAITETMSLIPYGISSFNSSYKEQREKGASDENAKTIAAGAGAIEMLTEIVPIGEALKTAGGKAAAKSFISEFVKQSLEEGLEESVGTVLNTAFEYYVLQDDEEAVSTFQEYLNDYGFLGAIGRVALDALEEGAAGVLSGAASGVTSIGIGYSNANKQSILSNQIQSKYSNVDTTKTDTDYAKTQATEAEKYKNNPAQYMADQFDVEQRSKEGAKQRKTKLGQFIENTKIEKARRSNIEIKENLQDIADKEARGEELTAGERDYLFKNAGLSEETYNDLFGRDNNIVPEQYRQAPTNMTVTEADQTMRSAAADGDIDSLMKTYHSLKNSRVEGASEMADELLSDPTIGGQIQSKGVSAEQINAYKTSTQDAYIAGLNNKSREEVGALSHEAALAYNEGRQKYITNEKRTVIKSAELTNDEIQLDDGSVVKYEGFTEDGKIKTSSGIIEADRILSDSATSTFLKKASFISSEAARDEYINGIQSGDNVNQYDRLFNKAYKLALMGVSKDKASKSSGLITARDGILEAGYRAGLADYDNATQNDLVVNAARALGVKNKGAGRFVNHNNAIENASEIGLGKMLASITGLDVIVSNDEEMFSIGEKGYFDQNNSRIVVRGDKFGTVFHELSEFTEAYNAEGYQKLRKAIADFSADALGVDTLGRWNETYSDVYRAHGQDGSTREMAGEYTNDALIGLLATDEGAKRFGEWLAQNYKEEEATTLMSQLKEILAKLVKAIKNIANNSGLNPAQKALAKQSADDIRKCIDIFTEAFEGAIEEYSKIEAEVNQDTEAVGIAYSIGIDNSEGNKLSDEQIEYFANSKVVDKNGRLKVMHHGTSSYGFNIFDIKKAKAAGLYGRGFYFSDSDSHAGTYGKTYDVYLNIVDPIQPGNKTITKDQLIKFVNEVANDEDYGIDNYGYNATPNSVVNDLLKKKDDFAILQDINSTCIGDFAGAVKLFNKVNDTKFDGIIAPTETVAFYPEQIKLVDNKKPTTNPDMRFAIKVDPEEFKQLEKASKDSENVDFTKSLIAVHNLTLDQLDSTLELKGFPCPSVAVIKAGMEHKLYGPVSVMFKRDVIDPLKNKFNYIFGGDGYTPTFPTVEAKINSDKAWDIYDRVDKLITNEDKSVLGQVNLDDSNMQDYANRNNGDLVEAYKSKKALKLAFIREANADYKLPFKTETKDFVSREGHTNEILEYIPKALGKTKFSEYSNTLLLQKKILENPSIGKDIIKAFNEAYRNVFDLNEDFYGLEINLSFKPDVMKITRSFLDARDLAKGFVPETVQTFDREKFEADFEKNGGEPKYEEWLKSLFEGAIEKKGLRNNKDLFTPSGNRRSWEQLHDDYSLENVVKIMQKQDKRGADAFFANAAFNALSLKDFKSIEEVHKSEGQIRSITQDEYDSLKDKYRDELLDIANEIRMSNTFEGTEDAIQCMVEALQTGKTVAAIQRGLNKNAKWLNLKEDTAQRVYDLSNNIANMPTGYFEAKPMRAVWLEEIAKVILPSNASSELVGKLDNYGVPYEVYEAGNEDQRADILNNDEDLRFSISINEFYELQFDDDKNPTQTPIRFDEIIEADSYIKNIVEQRKKANKSLKFKGFAYSYNHVFLFENNGRRHNDYDIVFMIDADSVEANIHEVARDETRGYKIYIDWLNESEGIEHEIYSRSRELLTKGGTEISDGDIFEGEPSSYGRRYNGYTGEDIKKFSIQVDSTGRELTPEQQKFFANSKAVDDQGRLLKLYHGTGSAGFTVFKKGTKGGSWFTTSRRDAESYGGSEKTFVPGEKKTYRKTVGGNVNYKGLRFETEADRDSFIKAHPDIEDYRTPRELRKLYDDTDWKILDVESSEEEQALWDEYNRIKKLSNAIRDDFFEYEAENMGDIPIAEIANNPEKYSVVDLKRAWLALDSNAAFDGEYDEFETDEEYRDFLADNLRNQIAGIEDLNVRSRIGIGQEGEITSYIHSRVYEVYANVERPYYIDAYGEDLALRGLYSQIESALENDERDGVIVTNAAQGRYKDPATLVIVKDSNQVKLIDNTAPTSDSDIRYALDIDEAWMSVVDSWDEEVRILEQGEEALKNAKIDIPKLRSTAIKLRNEFGSTYNLNTFTSNLEKAFAYMQDQIRQGEKVNYNDFLGIVKDIARPVVEASNEMIGQEEYDAFVSALKGFKIKLNEKQKKEAIYLCGSYDAYRRAMMPITISEKGKDLDSMWEQLCDLTWMLEKNTSDTQQPYALMDALDQVKPTPSNIYGGDIEDVARDLALRIVEEYFGGETGTKIKQKNDAYKAKLKADYDDKLKKARADLRKKGDDRVQRFKDSYNHKEKEAKYNARWKEAELKKKYDDKAQELKNDNAEYRQELRDRYEQRKDKLDKDYLEKQAQLIARNKENAAKTKERQLVREEKIKIKKRATKLLDKINNPTEKRHIPRDLVQPLLQFLHLFDFVQPKVYVDKDGTYYVNMFKRSYIAQDGSRHPEYEKITGQSRADVLTKYFEKLNLGVGSRDALSWVDKMKNISDLYDAAERGDEFDGDMSVFIDNLDASLAEEFRYLIQDNGQIDINSLSSEALQTINKVIRNIEKAISQGNKAFTLDSEVPELGGGTIDSADGKKDLKLNKVTQPLYNMLRINNLTPKVFLHLLGDSGKKLYKSMRDGLNTKIADVKKASEYMSEALKDFSSKDIQSWSGATAKVHEIDVSDGLMRITTAQIMCLYETLKRSGANERTSQGIRIGKIERKGFASDIDSQKVYILNYADKQKLFSLLTDEQKALADKMQKYLAVDCANDGNEMSYKLYGYKKFTDNTYWPWRVDKNEVQTKDQNELVQSFNGVERSGFTKALVKGAKNTLVIDDIFDVFTDHVSGMASYHGLAAANKDMLKWFNYREGNGRNVKNAIEKMTGKAGTQYIKKLMLDMNESEKSKYIGTGAQKIMGNYKAAAVGGNIRVVIQQPTAYFRALATVSPKYLFTVNPVKAIKNIKAIQDMSMISWWKSQGYFDAGLNKSMKQMIIGNIGVAENVKEKSMSLAGIADDVTWSFLYTAVENEQKAKLKKQNLSEEEFRKAVNDRFDEVVDMTQVVDSTLHRSQLMRGNDSLNVIQTAFMSEPTKSYNMLVEAALDDAETGNIKAGKFAKAVAAYTIAGIATSAASAVMDAFRYDDDDTDWVDVWIEYFKKNMIDNLNPLNMLPYIKDVWPLLYNAAMGESEYGSTNSRMDMELWTSAANLISEVMKIADGSSNRTTYGKSMLGLKFLSQATGMPLYNMTRDTVALTNQFHDDLKTMVETVANKKKVALTAIEKGDLDKFEEKSAELLEAGVTAKDQASYYKRSLRISTLKRLSRMIRPQQIALLI